MTEIQYYKQLATAVEKRLKVLEIAKETVVEKNKNELNKDNHEVPTLNHDKTNDLNFELKSNNIDHPTKDTTGNLIDFDNTTTEKAQFENLVDKDIGVSEFKQKPLEQANKSISDEDKSYLNETLLGDSASSDTITASTDLNQYLNTSVSTKTDTTETTPENWKPQVPKTLDIVPITLDQSSHPDKSSITDDETPKLVRRGSYVLESPSPMLLAHMQNELTTTEYTPTSSAQSVKRKEWTLSQVKKDWAAQNHFKEPNAINKFRKGNHTKANIHNHRICKSVSNSKTGSPLEVYQPAKSVDCIQTMFAKECYSSKTVSRRASNQSQKYSSPLNGTNGIRNSCSKKPNKSPSILNLANKLSESLGSLRSASPKPVKRIEKKNGNESIVNKSFDQDSNKTNETVKQKPVITSEKIVTVFREIQETHKKQMFELMTRQQKEQMLMQENFKKQQILLLAQIRKAFPEISISALTEAISGKHAEHVTPPSSKTVGEKCDSTPKQRDMDQPQVNGINCDGKNKQLINKSPMDYNTPRKLSSTSCHLKIQSTTPTVAPNYQSTCQATQTFDDSSPIFFSRSQFSNTRLIDDIPVGNTIHRHSSVSRQLFPLDSKTTHIPVLDNSMYTKQHVSTIKKKKKKKTLLSKYLLLLCIFTF